MKPKCPKCGGETTPYHNFANNKLEGYDCYKCNINDVENYLVDSNPYTINQLKDNTEIDPIKKLATYRIKVKLSDNGVDIINYVLTGLFDPDEDSVTNAYIDFDKDLILLEDDFNKVVFSGQISNITNYKEYDPWNQAPESVFQVSDRINKSIKFYYNTGKRKIQLMEYYI
jgi:hypothetical protein